jgi:hypothetical protein
MVLIVATCWMTWTPMGTVCSADTGPTKIRWLEFNSISLFDWLISHQPAVLFSQNKPATNNQPTVLFSQNKPAPAISHQPTEQAK